MNILFCIKEPGKNFSAGKSETVLNFTNSLIIQFKIPNTW